MNVRIARKFITVTGLSGAVNVLTVRICQIAKIAIVVLVVWRLRTNDFVFSISNIAKKNISG